MLRSVTAANLVPSAEEATDHQWLVGALVCVQVWANTALTAVRRALKRITSNSGDCFFMVNDL